MTRIVALRASVIVPVLALLLGAAGGPVRSSLVLVGASLSVLLLLFAATPQRLPAVARPRRADRFRR